MVVYQGVQGVLLVQEAVVEEHWGQLGMQYAWTASCVWLACMAGAQLG